MKNMSLLDPAPEEWLNARMFKILKDTISPSLLILREAKVQQTVLESWVALQLGETESERLIWARSQWEYRIETLF